MANPRTPILHYFLSTLSTLKCSTEAGPAAISKKAVEKLTYNLIIHNLKRQLQGWSISLTLLFLLTQLRDGQS